MMIMGTIIAVIDAPVVALIIFVIIIIVVVPTAWLPFSCRLLSPADRPGGLSRMQ